MLPTFQIEGDHSALLVQLTRWRGESCARTRGCPTRRDGKHHRRRSPPRRHRESPVSGWLRTKNDRDAAVTHGNQNVTVERSALSSGLEPHARVTPCGTPTRPRRHDDERAMIPRRHSFVIVFMNDIHILALPAVRTSGGPSIPRDSIEGKFSSALRVTPPTYERSPLLIALSEYASNSVYISNT